MRASAESMHARDEQRAQQQANGTRATRCQRPCGPMRAAERTAMRTAREQRDASAHAGPCERQSALPCERHASSAMPAPVRAQRAVASVSHSIAQEARASARRSSLRGGRVPREWLPVGGPTAWSRTTGRYRPPHAPVDRGSDWQQPRAVDCHPPGLRVVSNTEQRARRQHRSLQSELRVANLVGELCTPPLATATPQLRWLPFQLRQAALLRGAMSSRTPSTSDNNGGRRSALGITVDGTADRRPAAAWPGVGGRCQLSLHTYHRWHRWCWRRRSVICVGAFIIERVNL
jgi:hypothetical protein